MGNKIKKQIKIIATKSAEKSVFFRNIYRGLLNTYRLIMYKIRTAGIKVDKHTIIFSCFNGQSYTYLI